MSVFPNGVLLLSSEIGSSGSVSFVLAISRYLFRIPFIDVVLGYLVAVVFVGVLGFNILVFILIISFYARDFWILISFTVLDFYVYLGSMGISDIHYDLQAMLDTAVSVIDEKILGQAHWMICNPFYPIDSVLYISKINDF